MLATVLRYRDCTGTPDLAFAFGTSVMEGAICRILYSRMLYRGRSKKFKKKMPGFDWFVAVSYNTVV